MSVEFSEQAFKNLCGDVDNLEGVLVKAQRQLVENITMMRRQNTCLDIAIAAMGEVVTDPRTDPNARAVLISALQRIRLTPPTP